MKDTRITVVRKQPGIAPKLAVVDNELHTLQGLVDGYIEIACYFLGANGSMFAVVCDEEGRLKGKLYNIFYPWAVGMWECIAGDVFITKVKGEEFIDMTEEDAGYCFSWLEDQMSI